MPGGDLAGMDGRGGVRTTEAFSQNKRYPELDLDRANGCIRDFDHAYSQDGGLAVLYGNLALDGCIVPVMSATNFSRC